MSSPVHILGIGNLGKFVAHSLRKTHPELPITLLFHRSTLLDEWNQAGRQIEIVTNGVSDKREGFKYEILGAEGKGSERGEAIENLIVSTKTHRTVEAMTPLHERLGKESTVVFCQNGIGK
jgi:2-dehydropantoate 2-reductase